MITVTEILFVGVKLTKKFQKYCGIVNKVKSETFFYIVYGRDPKALEKYLSVDCIMVSLVSEHRDDRTPNSYILTKLRYNYWSSRVNILIAAQNIYLYAPFYLKRKINL